MPVSKQIQEQIEKKQGEILGLQQELHVQLRNEISNGMNDKVKNLEKTIDEIVVELNRFEQNLPARLPYSADRLLFDRVNLELRMIIERRFPRLSKMYEICETCNMGGHTCAGCGEEGNHSHMIDHWKQDCQ